MNEIFDLVYRNLKGLSKIFGVTYEEVNIIIWFFILPAIFVSLVDRIFKINYLKQGFAVVILIAIISIPSFEIFSKQLFEKSAAFLHWFDCLGLNYTQASVLICLIFPLLIILVLLYLKEKNKEK